MEFSLHGKELKMILISLFLLWLQSKLAQPNDINLRGITCYHCNLTGNVTRFNKKKKSIQIFQKLPHPLNISESLQKC